MSRFLNKQLTRAEDKKLGRVENHWSYNAETGRGVEGQHRCDAAGKPPNTFAFATPVGRSRGVAKPGDEAAGEVYAPPDYGVAMVAAPGRRRKK